MIAEKFLSVRSCVQQSLCSEMETVVNYVVFFTTRYGSLDEAFSKAHDVISVHLARTKEFHARGVLLIASALLNNPAEPLSTMAICTTREAAEEYARGDPFLLNGLVSNWYIREWADMFAQRT